MPTYLDTPVATDLYSRIMARSYTEQIPINTGFMAFFGRTETGSETHYSPNSNLIEIDIQRGTKGLAATVNRGTYGISIGDAQKALLVDRFSNFQRTYPLIEEKANIASNQLLSRVMGESPNQGMTQKQRLQKLALKANQICLANVYRTHEYLASQSIMTGKMPAITGTSDTSLIYDFKRTTAHQKTLTTKWTDVAADAAGDLDVVCEFIRIDGNMPADFCGMGDTALLWFKKNTAILAQSDNRTFFKYIELTDRMPAKYQRFVDAGWIPQFIYRTPKGHVLYVFSYQAHYVDSSSTVQPYLDKEQVLVASTQARCDRYFGPPERLPLSTYDRQLYMDYFGYDVSGPPQPPKIEQSGAIIDKASCYFDAFRDTYASALTARVQSAPVYATTATDGFAVILNAGAS
jgi:hypothetical protein